MSIQLQDYFPKFWFSPLFNRVVPLLHADNRDLPRRGNGNQWQLNLISERIKDVVTVSLLENDLALKSGTLFYENWAKPNLTGRVIQVHTLNDRCYNRNYIIRCWQIAIIASEVKHQRITNNTRKVGRVYGRRSNTWITVLKVYFQFWMWNIKNPEEFQSQNNGQGPYVPPEIEEIGPYSYIESYEKTNIHYENGAYENSSWIGYK